MVVQNYEVDEAAHRLGDSVAISEFSGPIHTNFPLLVLVEPESSWRITLIYDRAQIGFFPAWNSGATISFKY